VDPEVVMKKEIVLAGMWLAGCVGGFAASDVPQEQADWKTMLPMVQLAVRHEFPRLVAQAHYTATITKTADVAPGVQVALVDLGSGGYTADMTVMRLEGSTPVAAKFKGRDKKIAPKVFLSGTGEGRGDFVDLVPKDQLVFTGHWEMTKKNKLKCGGEAYQWDGKGKQFEFEKKLTKSMSREYCDKAGAASALAAPAISTETTGGTRAPVSQ
jgi:hypothetical protein